MESVKNPAPLQRGRSGTSAVRNPLVRFALLCARATAIGFFMGKALVLWFFGWLLLLLSFRGKERRQAWFGARLTGLFRDLGATFVKVGQIMSTRPDLLPPHVTDALRSLQDDVGAFAYKHVERSIREDFGKSPAELFATFETTPIASASVAQVHRASLSDGTELAVKVMRPNIERIAEFDLTVMRTFARLMCIVPSVRLLAPVESVDEFGHSIREQMDFRVEAENNRRFHRNFAGDETVEFPPLREALCSKRVLTMGFVRGGKILGSGRQYSDGTTLAKVGFQTLLKMVFEDGFVHADLHPGNIFVTPEGKVAILDLGLTAELDDQHRRIFAQYFASWASGDGRTMADLMLEFSPSAKVKDMETYRSDVDAFVQRYYGKQLGEVAVSQVAFDMMSILRRHRVRVNATFTMCNIAIAVCEGLGRQLDDELDLMNEALPFFAKLHQRAQLMDGAS